MAETPLKRHREETQIEELDDSKRHKSYNHILSLLEADHEEEPNSDLSSLITTLQQELSTESAFDPPPCYPAQSLPDENLSSAASAGDYSSPSSLNLTKEDDKERVIRHLLEASDDELGIPSSEIRVDEGEGDFNGGDCFSLYGGLWEFEDEAANYNTLLQSELFM
ncbi:uncharacterized protein LOC131144207 [Malania oleifera]|uniref:uncharacterized protein LOC131144207 n=1 Tax=Malania oleifera TaxID=397392 RepID=UPI0025AEB168|nr:uncharacterized protein LOC131144207 [Malania oleifera]